MLQHVITYAIGLLGGLTPGGFKLAWSITRSGKSVDAGTIDLSRYKA
jgi:hypothetical protein